MQLTTKKTAVFGLAAALSLTAIVARADTSAAGEYRWVTFAVFAAVIALTMYITYLAAKRVKSASDFYTAGGGISGLQNGWAIAGDYLSAASFLGIAGLISLYGYDGFMYSVGWLVAYITVLLLIAEPCRNIGKYTLSDILAYRNDPRKTRIVGALSVITVSTFYLTAQMVGGGVLVKTLIGIDYEVSVIVVGILMLSYVLFGGMVATTWVQIIKAVLLVAASVLIVMLVWTPYGFSLPGFMADVIGDAKVQARVATLLGDAAKNMTPAELGQRFLEPGLYFKAPIDQISLGMALVFGTAGLPHILMRFFTVPTAQQARKSVVWAMAIIGGFYVLTLFLGFGAAQAGGARQHRRGRRRRQHGGPAARAVHRRRTELVLRQLHAGVRLGGRVRDHRRGGRRAGARGRLGDGARPVGRRRPWRRDGRAAAAGAGGAHCDGDRRRDGDRDRHRGQGPERRGAGGARLRGRGERELPVRAADAVLEALQYDWHRHGHDPRHGVRGRPDARVAELDLPEGGACGRPQGARWRDGQAGVDRRGDGFWRYREDRAGQQGQDQPGQGRQEGQR